MNEKKAPGKCEKNKLFCAARTNVSIISSPTMTRLYLDLVMLERVEASISALTIWTMEGASEWTKGTTVG